MNIQDKSDKNYELAFINFLNFFTNLLKLRALVAASTENPISVSFPREVLLILGRCLLSSLEKTCSKICSESSSAQIICMDVSTITSNNLLKSTLNCKVFGCNNN